MFALIKWDLKIYDVVHFIFIENENGGKLFVSQLKWSFVWRKKKKKIVENFDYRNYLFNFFFFTPDLHVQ